MNSDDHSRCRERVRNFQTIFQRGQVAEIDVQSGAGFNIIINTTTIIIIIIIFRHNDKYIQIYEVMILIGDVTIVAQLFRNEDAAVVGGGMN